MLVASGIGITPFFSVMATRVADEQSFESDKDVYNALFKENLVRTRGSSITTVEALKLHTNWNSVEDYDVQPIRVVWSIRDVTELLFYLDYVYELVKHQNVLHRPAIEVDVYLTGIGKKTDIAYLISQTLFMLTLASKTSKYMRIHFGRPHLEAIITTNDPDSVYYCGGKQLKESLNDLCIERKIPFHPEDFDSGTHVLNDITQFIAKATGTSSRQKQARRRRNIKLSRLSLVSIRTNKSGPSVFTSDSGVGGHGDM
jgi:ferredoxin-NADP reductase